MGTFVLKVDYVFSSEAPGKEGWPQKIMLKLNLEPQIIFDDLLVNTSIGLASAMIHHQQHSN